MGLAPERIVHTNLQKVHTVVIGELFLPLHTIRLLEEASPNIPNMLHVTKYFTNEMSCRHLVRQNGKDWKARAYNAYNDS